MIVLYLLVIILTIYKGPTHANLPFIAWHGNEASFPVYNALRGFVVAY